MEPSCGGPSPAKQRSPWRSSQAPEQGEAVLMHEILARSGGWHSPPLPARVVSPEQGTPRHAAHLLLDPGPVAEAVSFSNPAGSRPGEPGTDQAQDTSGQGRDAAAPNGEALDALLQKRAQRVPRKKGVSFTAPAPGDDDDDGDSSLRARRQRGGGGWGADDDDQGGPPDRTASGDQLARPERVDMARRAPRSMRMSAEGTPLGVGRQGSSALRRLSKSILVAATPKNFEEASAPLCERSLMLFPKASPPRKQLIQVVTTQMYDWVMLVIIFANCVALAVCAGRGTRGQGKQAGLRARQGGSEDLQRI